MSDFKYFMIGGIGATVIFPALCFIGYLINTGATL